MAERSGPAERARPAAGCATLSAMTDAYARAGVDTGGTDQAVGALVDVLRSIDPGRASRSVLASGHYAAVLEVAPNLGIAVGTDGVGSKLIVAEQTGRLDTVGIDCVAMNVNDVVCVGAEPIALLDYLAVERADAEAMRAIGHGLKRGRRGGRGRDPRRRGRGAAGADPRPPLARRHRPHGRLLRHRGAGPAGDGRAHGARRRGDRPAVERPALQRLHARAPGAARRRRRPRPRRAARRAGRRERRRRAARADRDLRARGARAAAGRGRRRPRARAHHRRRAAQPAAPARAGRLRADRPAAGRRRSSA